MPFCCTVLLLLTGAIPALCYTIPLTFFGPLSSSVFVAQGGSATVFFRAGGITFSKNGKTASFDFLGQGSAAVPSGANALRGRVNIAGSENDLLTFGSIEYRSLYAGITLRFMAEGRRLKSEYLIEAHHNPALFVCNIATPIGLRSGRMDP
jgi:hypothetical protein